jgi:hypothetical protein
MRKLNLARAGAVAAVGVLALATHSSPAPASHREG